MSRFDGKALELSRQAMALFFEPMPGVQLQAKLQNLFISAMEYAEPVTAAAGWIKCSERMPEDAQWCVVNTEYGYYAQCWSAGQGWLGDDVSIPNVDVTHWMPLPAAPEQEV